MHRKQPATTIFKRAGIRVEASADGLLATCARPGTPWVQFLQALAAHSLSPQVTRRGVTFDSVEISMLANLIPKKALRWRWVIVLPVLASIAFAGVLAPVRDKPAVAKRASCESSKTLAKNFAIQGVGDFTIGTSVQLGGVRVLQVASTCSDDRYEITLAEKPARVISVKLK